MIVERTTYDPAQQTRFDEIMKGIRPTTDTGEVLETRVRRMHAFVRESCGELGNILATKWPQNIREVSLVVPVAIPDKHGEMDAVLEISVCLYDNIKN